MSTRYRTGDDECPHFITFSVIEWIDALTRNIYKDIITESLAYCIKEKGLRLNAWIIMSNHVHLVLSVKRGQTISNLLRDMKKFTSKQIIAAIQNNPSESRKAWLLYMFARAGKRNSNNTTFQFWQQDNHPIELVTPAMLEQKLEYLHNNPVKAGIVYQPEQYVYSSALDYYTGKKGLIEIQHLHC